jgi:hypothetical protein
LLCEPFAQPLYSDSAVPTGTAVYRAIEGGGSEAMSGLWNYRIGKVTQKRWWFFCAVMLKP